METVPRDGSLQLGLAHDGIALTVVCPQCVLARPNRDPCKTRKKWGGERDHFTNHQPTRTKLTQALPYEGYYSRVCTVRKHVPAWVRADLCTPFAYAQIDGIFVTDDAMSATVSPKLGIDRNKYDVKSIFTEYI